MWARKRGRDVAYTKLHLGSPTAGLQAATNLPPGLAVPLTLATPRNCLGILLTNMQPSTPLVPEKREPHSKTYTRSCSAGPRSGNTYRQATYSCSLQGVCRPLLGAD